MRPYPIVDADCIQNALHQDETLAREIALASADVLDGETMQIQQVGQRPSVEVEQMNVRIKFDVVLSQKAKQ
jgi:hypothetical protein